MNRRYLFLFVIVVAVTLFACSTLKLAYYEVPKDPQYIKRGNYLVNSLATCSSCHSALNGDSLSGGRSDSQGVIAANITTDETGLGGWSANDVMRAIRSSISKDGTNLSFAAHDGYYWMSDQDALSIVAYLATLPAVYNEIPKVKLSFLKRKFDTKRSEMHGFVPEVKKGNKIAYGKYLIDNVARCQGCHASPDGLFSSGAYLEGGRKFEVDGQDVVVPALLGENGLGDWAKDDIVSYLSTSSPDSLCPTESYSKASREDLELIANYIHSRF